jgi:hypothetical protein
VNERSYHQPGYPINPFDLYAKDARAFRAAGLGMTVINELEGHAIRAASDIIDWSVSDLLRIHRVGPATVSKMFALVEMA